MEELGAFVTLAQIALGIAGSSGVVVTVSDRPAHDSLRILSLLAVSLGLVGLQPPSRVSRPGSRPCERASA